MIQGSEESSFYSAERLKLFVVSDRSFAQFPSSFTVVQKHMIRHDDMHSDLRQEKMETHLWRKTAGEGGGSG